MTSIRILAAGSLLALGLAGCSQGEDNQLAPAFFNGDADQVAIYYGSPPDQPYHDATASVHYAWGGSMSSFFCSSSLIFDRWVLTAAHCVDGLGNSDVYINFGRYSTNSDYSYRSTRVIMNTAYNPNFATSDVALVQLGSTPTYADPVPPLPDSLKLSNSDLWDQVNIAGFGEQETGASGVLEQTDVPVTSISSKEYTMSMTQDGFCFGDSGGPTFIDRNGTTYVTGVHSTVSTNRCNGSGRDMNVAGFESWIETQTGEQVGEVDGVPTETELWAGSLTDQKRKPHRYSASTGGTHNITSSGSIFDADLFLLKDTGSGPYNGYEILASSENLFTDDESIRYTDATGGDYIVGIWSQIGDGTYLIEATHPL